MSTIVQLVGITAITVGAAILSVPVGLIVGGSFLIIVGVSLGRK